MASIRVQGLTFAYDGSYDTIFDNVSFTLDTNWKLGFVGRNGRGKTTFLKLLLGELDDGGAVRCDVPLCYFPFETPDMALSAREILHDLCPEAQDWQMERELSLLEIERDASDRPFSTLSGGERTKVMLSALFLGEERFLLIDEPTNHLDMRARRIVGDYLNAKRGFILVSHDRALLDACTDHTLSINRANIELQRGGFSSWQQNKERQDAFELAENEKLEKDIRRLKRAARQSSDWADRVESTKIGSVGERHHQNIGSRDFIGEQSRRMQQRRKNLERRQQAAIEEKSGLLHNLERADALKLHPLTHPAGRLLRLDRVCVRYGDKPAVREVSFELNNGERIALCGRNGCGKSTLLRLVCGEQLAYTGGLARASRLRISYVAQDTRFLCGNLIEYAQSCGADITLFLTILRKLDFERVQFEKDMASYSAGQKKKVLLARSLSESAELYIWDEPLNYIDLLSRMQIETLLKEYAPTMLFVEHDRAFCEAVSTRMLWL